MPHLEFFFYTYDKYLNTYTFSLFFAQLPHREKDLELRLRTLGTSHWNIQPPLGIFQAPYQFSFSLFNSRWKQRLAALQLHTAGCFTVISQHFPDFPVNQSCWFESLKYRQIVAINHYMKVCPLLNWN